MSAPKPCPLCGAPDAALLFVKGESCYRKCRRCRFVFNEQPGNPNLENALDHFEPSYIQYLRPDRGDERNFQSLRQWMSGFCTLEGATSLDVGAGSGKLVRFLRQSGVNARGIEPSRALFDYFLSDDPAFQHGTLETCRPPARTFDIVTAFDVIEHVLEPAVFLEEIASIIKPGGVLFVSTPNVGSLTARVFGRRWHFFHTYHLSYFSPSTLAAAAQPRGFSLLGWCHRGRLRSAGYILRYVVEVIGRGKAPAWIRRLDDLYFPVNLFDTMYLAFRRSE